MYHTAMHDSGHNTPSIFSHLQCDALIQNRNHEGILVFFLKIYRFSE